MMVERLGTALASRLDRRRALVGLGTGTLSIAAGLFRAARPLPETGFQYYCCSLCRPHSETCQAECTGYLYWWRCPYMRWTFLCTECFSGDNGTCWGCDMATCSYYVQES
jgi:hypothetical protein